MGALILHIGMGRAGSTSIQGFAARHRAALRARGLDYPSVPELGLAGEADRDANGDVLFRASRAEDPGPVFRAVADHAAQSPMTCLVSSEGLFTADHQAMAGFRAMLDAPGVKLRVVAYLREQTAWIISRWAHGVKMGWTRSLDDCLDRPPMGGSLDYPRRFEELADVYGASVITPRLFQRGSLIGGDLRTDILALAGVDAADLAAGQPPLNASTSAEELLAMRRVNEERSEGVDHRPFLAFAEEWARENGVAFTRDLHRLADPRRLARLRRRYAPLNEAFRETWLADAPSPLFDAPFPVDYTPLDIPALERTADALLADFRRTPANPSTP